MFSVSIIIKTLLAVQSASLYDSLEAKQIHAPARVSHDIERLATKKCPPALRRFDGIVAQVADSFDELRLAVQWLPGLHSVKKKFVSTRKLRRLRSVGNCFTIHGLWPSKLSGHHQLNCFCEKFNGSEIKHLLPRLEQFWPSLYKGDNEAFWSHEWHKHGSCAASVPELSSQAKYFNWALDGFEKLPLTRLFGGPRVTADSNRKYPLRVLRETVESQVGSRVSFNCRKRKQTGVCLIGIVICFDPERLILTNCSSSDDQICMTDDIVLALL